MRQKKIHLLLHGGIGNQLFQYCFYKQKFDDKKHKINFFFNNDQWIKQNNSNINFLLNLKIKFIKNNFKSKLNYFLKKIFLFKEITDLNSDEKIKNSKIIINGYFQSSKCHREYYQKLCRDIYLKKIKKILSNRKINYCSIAIRRSDFVKLGWSIKLKYYFKALKKLKINKKYKIKIISEDSEFGELFSLKLKSLGYKSELIKNKSKKFDKSINDFINLINSENLIIANSSFSWWAANIRAVAGFDDTRVCSPKIWFPKTFRSPLNVKPEISKNWKQIPNTF